ncbi:MAG TPA: hypothetical protein VHW00_11865 [Thermoanaerobaculia bacterium]|nr:hypothetical protein [Thermoanaerobaculia bacterium]
MRKPTNNVEKTPADLISNDEHDAEIAEFESMPIEEIDARLASLGIDARPTVEAVKRLVDEALEQWQSTGPDSTTKN